MKIFPSRRTVKRLGIGVAILLGGALIVNGFFSWRTEARFRRIIRDIRAAGDPASIADLKPAPIPDEVNAAAAIDKLAPRLEEFANEQGRFYKTDLGKAYGDLKEGEQPTAEQIAAMRTILDKYADLEQMIVAAAAMPQFASTADFSLGFHDYLEAQIDRVSRIRTIARYIHWRTQMLVAEGRREEALDLGLKLLRLSELNESEPTMMSFLVTIVVRNIALQNIFEALSAGPVSEETHQHIDEALGRIAQGRPDLDYVLRTERAVSSTSMDQVGEMIPSPISSVLGWSVKRHFIDAVESYEPLFEVAGLPWYELKPMFAAGELTARSEGGVLAELLLPSLQASFKAASRDAAMIRALRVYNALLMAEQAGHEPQGLDGLDLPAEETVDPFTGQPLIVKRTDRGWVVYSVGLNEVDDGGEFEKGEDSGFGE
jgi:hypothetical protein